METLVERKVRPVALPLLKGRGEVLTSAAEKKELKISAAKAALEELHKMFSDRRFTSDDFIKQKAIEREIQ